MRKRRHIRKLKALAVGACLLQSSGCTQQEFVAFLQTVFLGITAAGAIVIIDNV